MAGNSIILPAVRPFREALGRKPLLFIITTLKRVKQFTILICILYMFCVLFTFTLKTIFYVIGYNILYFCMTIGLIRFIIYVYNACNINSVSGF